MRLNVSLFKPMLFCDVDELLPKVEEPKMSRVELLFGLSTLGSCQNTEELWSTHARTHARTDETVFLPRQLFNPRAKRGEKTYENHRKPSKTIENHRKPKGGLNSGHVFFSSFAVRVV